MKNHRVPDGPASLFLDEKTFRLYCLWQREHNVVASIVGRISSAFEYHNFLTWLKARNDDIATIRDAPQKQKLVGECEHTLHPALPLVSTISPVCRVQICLDYLEVIRVAWIQHEDNPGRPIPEEISARNRRSGYLALWRKARIELEVLKTSLEKMIAVEAVWEVKNIDENVKSAYSATKALAKANAEVKYPACIKAKADHGTVEAKLKCTKPKKKVSFVRGTNFDPGRARLFWDRGSPDYQAGQYSCSLPDGWFNSSNYTIPRFNASQWKLYVVKSVEQYRAIQKDLRILTTLQHEGQVSLHRLWKEIQGENEQRMLAMESKQGNAFYHSSNTIVVLENVNGIVSKRMFVNVPNPDNDGGKLRDEDMKSFNGKFWASLNDIRGKDE